MNGKEKQRKYSKSEIGEDATQYGEFVSSYFAWITLSEQKERAERLQNITKNPKNNNKQ